MILYHGSIEQVKKPEIRRTNRALDYGSGFYTTTSERQATLWVKRKLGQKAVQVTSMSMNWTKHIAELINELKTYVLVDQWLFHTECSLHYLIFKEAKEVKG